MANGETANQTADQGARLPTLPSSPSPSVVGEAIRHVAMTRRGFDPEKEPLVKESITLLDRMREADTRILQRADAIYGDSVTPIEGRHYQVLQMSENLGQRHSEAASQMNNRLNAEIERITKEMDDELRRVPTDPNSVEIAREVREKARTMNATDVANWVKEAAGRNDWIVAAALLSAPVELWGKGRDPVKLIRESVLDVKFPGARKRLDMLDAVNAAVCRAITAHEAWRLSLYNSEIARRGKAMAERAEQARRAAAAE